MFKKKLMDKLAKKGKKELDPNEQKAKVGVIKEMSFQAGSMMGDRVKGLKKGLSESDSELEHPAENSLADHTGSPAKGQPGDGDSNPDGLSDEKDEGEDFKSEHEDCSPEELDQKIKDLQDIKAKKQSSKY